MLSFTIKPGEKPTNRETDLSLSGAKQALHKFVDEITDEDAVFALRVLKAALTDDDD